MTVTYDLWNDGEPAIVRFDLLTNGVSIGRTHFQSITGAYSTTTTNLVYEGRGKQFVWDAHKDWPGNLSDKATVRVLAYYTNRLEYLPDVYMVIDLTGGPTATNYPVSYTFTKPDLNSTACFLTQLWLKHIEPGSFTMGAPTNGVEYDLMDGTMKTNEAPRSVTLTKPFFAGVFEVTRAQYKNVTGIGDNIRYAMARLGYFTLRGTNDVEGAYDWPVNGHDVAPRSFMGLLRAKTGLPNFDLPTEAQWEYASRAGTTTTWNNGTMISNADSDPELTKLAIYKGG